MNPIKKIIIIFVLAFVGTIIISPTALAFWQCGIDVESCKIIEFDFNKGITPIDADGNPCFDGARGINMAVGWCDFLQIISNVIGLLYAIVIPIAIIMIIVGGVILMTAGGSEKQIKQGQAFLKSAIIGLIIALGAGIIVGLIIRGLGVVEGTTLMPWLF